MYFAENIEDRKDKTGTGNFERRCILCVVLSIEKSYWTQDFGKKVFSHNLFSKAMFFLEIFKRSNAASPRISYTLAGTSFIMNQRMVSARFRNSYMQAAHFASSRCGIRT
jgi:hypothetical protein